MQAPYNLTLGDVVLIAGTMLAIAFVSALLWGAVTTFLDWLNKHR